MTPHIFRKQPIRSLETSDITVMLYIYQNAAFGHIIYLFFLVSCSLYSDLSLQLVDEMMMMIS